MLGKVKRTAAGEPQVGIFWLVSGNLVIDSTPLTEAEPYGDFLIHPGSHLEAWRLFQRSGSVPANVEYEELPRGRVVYNTRTQRFTLLADTCILRDTDIVNKIMFEMNLPNRKTCKGTDSHYRCFVCLQGKND
jgi:hypothetical protein